MSMATLETAILRELREVAKNPKLRKKDIAEWSTSEFTPQEGEAYYFLPALRIYVAVTVGKLGA